jgi:hypothetical protein
MTTERLNLSTIYLPGEGRTQLKTCMRYTFKFCAQAGIQKIVIFTATGEGPLLAVRKFLPQPRYRNIELIAVTLPSGRAYPIDPRSRDVGLTTPEIAVPIRKFLIDSGVPVITPDKLPFSSDGLEGDDRLRNVTLTKAFDALGGGLSFCIQSALVACDHEAISVGERIAAMTSDTSIVAVASNTKAFLSPVEGFLLEHIICRPAIYNISKSRHRVTQQAMLREAERVAQLSLEDLGGDDDDE